MRPLIFFCSSRSLTSMNRTNLLNFLNNSNRFTFAIGKYRIPKLMLTEDSRYVDVEWGRNSNLDQEDSVWVNYFNSILQCYTAQNLNYYREFPLIIERRDRWENYCLANMALDDKFLADYYFPDYNLVVEIDSDLHDSNYDSARDDYIKEVWGCNILRFPEFGCTAGNQSYCIKQFNSAIKNKQIITNNIVYNKTLLSRFKYEYESILPHLNALERIIVKYPEEKIIDITKYGKVFGNFMDYKNIREILFGMYGVSVISKAYNP